MCNVVPAEGLVLIATEDAYINGVNGQQNRNFGSANPLLIRPDNTGDRRGLLKFSMPALPPGASVSRAILYVYEINERVDNSIAFFRITSDWQEATVTWNSNVTFEPAALGSLSTIGADNCMRAIDLPPSLVQGWIDGSISNNGVLLMATGKNGDIQIASREEMTNLEQRPQLYIEYQ